MVASVIDTIWFKRNKLTFNDDILGSTDVMIDRIIQNASLWLFKDTGVDSLSAAEFLEKCKTRAREARIN